MKKITVMGQIVGVREDETEKEAVKRHFNLEEEE